MLWVTLERTAEVCVAVNDALRKSTSEASFEDNPQDVKYLAVGHQFIPARAQQRTLDRLR